MLPEKRKNLITIIVAIIIVAIIALVAAIISGLIHEKRENENIRRNDIYPVDYKYMGLVEDNENIFRIYGITKEYNEKYLGVRSFYKTTDIVNINDKITLYSDAVNEIRYDKKAKEYYLYAIDDFYEQNIDVLIGNGYIIYFKDNNIYMHINGNDKKDDELISDKSIYNAEGLKGIIYNNKFYYLEDDGIHEYAQSTKENNLIIGKEEKNEIISIIDADNGYLVYKENGIYKIYGLGGHMSININSSITNTGYNEVKFIGYTSHDILIEVKKEDGKNSLLKYSIMNNSFADFEIDLEGFTIVNSYIVNSSTYYLDLINDMKKEKHIIVDLTNGRVLKELENKYEKIVVVR